MNKKLLILGGTQISLQILKAAKSMGILVYVADYYEDSPCKKLADKSFLVSATDVDSISKLIEDEKIDGVLMGYADVLLNSYVDICEKSGLPCYGNKRAIKITSEKQLFKDYCRKFNIPVVPEYSFEDVENGSIKYPIIIKPVDNSGSRGVYKCHHKAEFDRFYPLSMEFSPSKKVLIEKMMSAPEATIFYYLHEGEVYLLGVADRLMHDQGNGILKLPVGYTFPSKHISDFKIKQNPLISEMFKSLNMREGMVFMQCFVENEEYIVYEMGYRLTGSIEHHLMEAQYGFNHLKAMINFAVNNSVDTTALLRLDPSSCNMANVSLLLNEGTIKSFDGFDGLNKIEGVVDYHLSYNSGDSIGEKQKGKLAQLGMRILVIAHDRRTLIKKMDMVKDSVHAYDTDGNDMFIKNYKYEKICQ